MYVHVSQRVAGVVIYRNISTMMRSKEAKMYLPGWYERRERSPNRNAGGLPNTSIFFSA